MKKILCHLLCWGGIFLCNMALATTVTVGVTLPLSGPYLSLGIPEKNTVSMAPTIIDGAAVRYIVLDDEADATKAVLNAYDLINDYHIDIMIGSSVTDASLALVDIAADTSTPMISLNSNTIVVEPQKGNKCWAFKASQDDSLMASALKKVLDVRKARKIGIIAFDDAYGSGWVSAMQQMLNNTNIDITAIERFHRTETDVQHKIAKILSTKPDAVLVATASVYGILPQKEIKKQGYEGLILHTHGSANNAFLEQCGEDCEGIVLPVGPVVVASQLEESHPLKSTGLVYTRLYNTKFKDSDVNAFGAHMWDAILLVNEAVSNSLKKGARPGTMAFRQELRDSLENVTNLVGVHGIFNMSKNNHSGLDERARVIVTVKNGQWVYQPEWLK